MTSSHKVRSSVIPADAGIQKKPALDDAKLRFETFYESIKFDRKQPK